MVGIESAMPVAMAPTTKIETLITHIISDSEAFCLNINLYTFLQKFQKIGKAQ